MEKSHVKYLGERYACPISLAHLGLSLRLNLTRMQSTKYSRGRLAVSTPTAFDYLAVEEPEEEEEEESVEEQKPEPPAVVQPEPPVRRTK